MAIKLVDIECTEVWRTEKAIKIDDGATEAWVPLSLVEIEESGAGKKTITVTMSENMAKEKGLI